MTLWDDALLLPSGAMSLSTKPGTDKWFGISRLGDVELLCLNALV